MYTPGNYRISKNKVKKIIEILKLNKDDIKSLKRNLKNAKNTLKNGDLQQAKVISVDPLLIACYSDEFDNVLIYEYPTELVDMYSLEVGTCLHTSNSYWPKECFSIADDIISGDECTNNWRDIITFIPLFLFDEKQEISCWCYDLKDELLAHVDELIIEYKIKKPEYYRKGFNTLIKY